MVSDVQTQTRTVHRIVNGIEIATFVIEIPVQTKADLVLNDLIDAMKNRQTCRLPLIADGDYNTAFYDVPPRGGWL